MHIGLSDAIFYHFIQNEILLINSLEFLFREQMFFHIRLPSYQTPQTFNEINPC